jgi:hypothetical protein
MIDARCRSGKHALAEGHEQDEGANADLRQQGRHDGAQANAASIGGEDESDEQQYGDAKQIARDQGHVSFICLSEEWADATPCEAFRE